MLESTIPIKHLLKGIHIRDGRYKERTDTEEYDIKETYVVISHYQNRGFDNILSYTHSGNSESQVEKRNHLWNIVKEEDPDYTLVLDSDEYLKINLESLREHLDKLKDYPYRCIPVNYKNTGEMSRLPRLFKRPWNFKHIQFEDRLSHGSLWDDNNIDVTDEMNRYDEVFVPKRGLQLYQNAVNGLEIHSDKSTQSPIRLSNNKSYYDIINH